MNEICYNENSCSINDCYFNNNEFVSANSAIIFLQKIAKIKIMRTNFRNDNLLNGASVINILNANDKNNSNSSDIEINSCDFQELQTLNGAIRTDNFGNMVLFKTNFII